MFVNFFKFDVLWKLEKCLRDTYSKVEYAECLFELEVRLLFYVTEY